MNSLLERREFIDLAIFGGAGFAVGGTPSAMVADAEFKELNVASFPPQAWAHKSGAVALRRPGQVRSNLNALDYLLIHETLGRYGIAFDEGRDDVLQDLFTNDAILILAKGTPNPLSIIKGNESIVASFEDGFKFQADQRRHCFSNIVIENLSDTKASALAYAIVTVAANGLTIGATVIYSVDLQKNIDSHWQFSRMYIGMDDYSNVLPPIPEAG